MMWRSDEGFTLTEMLVVVTIMGVVLAAAIAAASIVESSNEVTIRQAQFSSDVSSPLHVMDKAFSQNTTITAGTAYSVTMQMPRETGSTTYKRYIFEATTAGQITQSVYQVSNSTGIATLANTHVWSSNNVNRSGNHALFTWIKADGTQTNLPSQANSVIIEVFTDNDGHEFTGKRQVFFRNR